MTEKECTEHYGNTVIEVYQCMGVRYEVLKCEGCGKTYETIEKAPKNPLEASTFPTPTQIYSLEKH